MSGRHRGSDGWQPSRLFEFGGAEAHRLRPMEGLRGIAVLLVFGVHYATLFEPWVEPGTATGVIAAALRQVGHAGVDLFFVLSGYLIYGAVIRRSVHYGRFMRRRVERIYPAFLAVFAVYLALSAAAPSMSKLPQGAGAVVAYLLANLLLLPGLFPIEPLITVAWSLSYEFAYYLALPLLVAGTGMRDWEPRRRMKTFAVAGVGFVALAAVVPWVPVRLGMFVAGIILYDALRGTAFAGDSGGPAGDRPGDSAGERAGDSAGVRPGERWAERLADRLSGRRGTSVVAGAALLAGVGSWVGAVGAPTQTVADALRVACLAPAFGAICAVAFLPRTGIGRWLCWSPLRWLGNMSYSFYLIHGLTVNLLSKAVLPRGPRGFAPGLFWGFLPVALAAAVAVSAVLFLAVERPFSLDGHGMTRLGLGRADRARRGAAPPRVGR